MVAAEKAPGKQNIYGRDNTFGGYSDVLVVNEDFVLKSPASLKPEVAAPILCTGVTTYSPLKHWGVMGVLKTDKDTLKQLKSSFDFILSTVPEKHDVNPFVELLKRDATLCTVGALEPLAPVNNQEVAFHRKSVTGSLIGSIAETQEVLDFCAAHNIGPDIGIIAIQDINDACKKWKTPTCASATSSTWPARSTTPTSARSEPVLRYVPFAQYRDALYSVVHNESRQGFSMPHLHLPLKNTPAFLPRDACCAPPLRTLPASAPVRRTKLVEIDANIHCSIIGTCLSTGELRKLVARYVPDLARKDATDVEIHHTAVNLSTEGGAVAKDLNKALDTRHALTIRKFSAARDERALKVLWQEAMAQGDVPGAYWALMTHPVSTFDLRTLAFGDVHMLSHLVGASNRADLRRLAALEQEAVQLRQQTASQQARIQAMSVQQAAMSAQAQALETRCAQYALASPQQLHDELATLRAAVAERDATLALHAARQHDTAQKRDTRQAQHDSAHAELVACRTDLAMARAELAALVHAFDDSACKPALPRLDGQCVLYVGGRPGATHVIGKLVAASGGELLVHDGGIEDRHGLLTSMLPRAQMVVFPVDCISHNAMQVAKQACARHGIACHPIRSASVASFIALMQHLAL